MGHTIKIVCYKVCTFYRRDGVESLTVNTLGEQIEVPSWVEKTMTFAFMLAEGSVIYADQYAPEAQDMPISASEPTNDAEVIKTEEQAEIPIVAAVEVVEEPVTQRRRTSKKKDDAE